MSDETARLKLAQLVALQELNAVTWNEALAQLDALVDLYLLGQFVNTPPSNPQDGDAYIVGGAPTGAWSGQPYKIASCLDGAWRFYTPYNGLRAFVAPSAAVIVYVNGTWTAVASSDFATRSGSETLRAKTFAGATNFPGATVINASGWLGINGTPTACYPLNVVTGGDYCGIRVAGSYPTFNLAGTESGGAIIQMMEAAGNFYFKNTTNAAGSFIVRNGVNADVLRLDFGAPAGALVVQGTAGNVGIGVPYPGAFRLQVAGHIGPDTANASNLGSASADFANGWIRNAWTVTSDRTLKTNFRAFSEAEMAAAAELAGRLCLYQWIDAVAGKGVDGARLHSGVAAQEARDVLARHGLEAARYGWFCADVMTEPVRKTRTVSRRKMQTVTTTVMHGAYVERDGRAVYVESAVSEMREEPVWANERDLPAFDEQGNPVMEAAGEAADGTPVQRQKMVHFADPVMEDVSEDYVEAVAMLDGDGAPRLRYSIRYSDLHNWLLAALAAKLTAPR